MALYWRWVLFFRSFVVSYFIFFGGLIVQVVLLKFGYTNTKFSAYCDLNLMVIATQWHSLLSFPLNSWWFFNDVADSSPKSQLWLYWGIWKLGLLAVKAGIWFEFLKRVTEIAWEVLKMKSKVYLVPILGSVSVYGGGLIIIHSQFKCLITYITLCIYLVSCSIWIRIETMDTKHIAQRKLSEPILNCWKYTLRALSCISCVD